jgi:hypothetical protein
MVIPVYYSVPQNSFPLPTGSTFSFATIGSAQEKITPGQSLLYSAERSMCMRCISRDPTSMTRVTRSGQAAPYIDRKTRGSVSDIGPQGDPLGRCGLPFSLLTW